MTQKLTLYPDTFLWCKGKKGLFYNARNGDMFRFEVTDSIGALCRQLKAIDNLYSILIDSATLDIPTRMFIGAIVDHGFGRVTDADSTHISLPPLLNLQHDIERLDKNKDHKIGDNVLRYLSTLTIYIGGNCLEKPYFKQIIYPVCSENMLDPETISYLLDMIWIPSLQTINLVVSDTSNSGIDHMEQSLNNHKNQIVFYFLYSDVKNKMVIPYRLVNTGYRVRFICEDTTDSFSEQTSPSSFGYDFIISNERDYRFWSDVAEKLGMKDYAMIPVYDNNYEFFAKNIFMDEADITEIHLSRREIFAHQTLNTNVFGKLTIMPNGSVYSDIAEPALGTINDSICDLIIKELEHNYSWRKIRDSTACKECIYQWLCPSPFSYERVAGKETACNFR